MHHGVNGGHLMQRESCKLILPETGDNSHHLCVAGGVQARSALAAWYGKLVWNALNCLAFESSTLKEVALERDHLRANRGYMSLLDP